MGLTNKLFLAILMTNNIGFAKFAIKTLFIVKFSKKENIIKSRNRFIAKTYR